MGWPVPDGVPGLGGPDDECAARGEFVNAGLEASAGSAVDVAAWRWAGGAAMNTVIQTYAKRLVAVVLALTVSGCGFSRVLADWKIDQLCKQDGGVKVFEKDVAPKEFLWPNGRIKAGEIALAKAPRSYYVESASKSIQIGEPAIVRIEHHLYRQRDARLLGTAVTYIRQVDTLGAFSPFRSSYTCPENGAFRNLLEVVFDVEAT